MGMIGDTGDDGMRGDKGEMVCIISSIAKYLYTSS